MAEECRVGEAGRGESSPRRRTKRAVRKPAACTMAERPKPRISGQSTSQNMPETACFSACKIACNDHHFVASLPLYAPSGDERIQLRSRLTVAGRDPYRVGMGYTESIAISLPGECVVRLRCCDWSETRS